MSYRYLVNAVSHIGEILHSTDEYYFADGLTSLNDGMSQNSRIRQLCKGRRHIFSVFSTNSNAETICRRLRSALGKQIFEKIRVKVQYNIRELMKEISGGIGKVCADADMSVIFIESGIVYACGYGDVNLYKYTAETGEAERITFPVVSEESQEMATNDNQILPENSEIPTFVRFVSKVSEGDEYLVLGSALADTVGEDVITEIFRVNRKNPIDEIVNAACDAGNLFTLTASRITVIKHMLSVYLWCGAGVLLILLLTVIFIFLI